MTNWSTRYRQERIDRRLYGRQIQPLPPLAEVLHRVAMQQAEQRYRQWIQRQAPREE